MFCLTFFLQNSNNNFAPLVECPDVVSELQEYDVPSMSPSLVCVECLGENDEATWLSYMTCLKPREHCGDRITVLVDDDELVVVRSGDHLSGLDIGEIMMCDYTPNCFRRQKCKFAHSEIELNYWRWKRAREIFCLEISEMVGKKTAAIKHHIFCALQCHIYMYSTVIYISP